MQRGIKMKARDITHSMLYMYEDICYLYQNHYFKHVWFLCVAHVVIDSKMSCASFHFISFGWPRLRKFLVSWKMRLNAETFLSFDFPKDEEVRKTCVDLEIGRSSNTGILLLAVLAFFVATIPGNTLSPDSVICACRNYVGNECSYSQTHNPFTSREYFLAL